MSTTTTPPPAPAGYIQEPAIDRYWMTEHDERL